MDIVEQRIITYPVQSVFPEGVRVVLAFQLIEISFKVAQEGSQGMLVFAWSQQQKCMKQPQVRDMWWLHVRSKAFSSKIRVVDWNLSNRLDF